ncbi:MAG: hypothetical protein GQ542_16670 [Desulforhopalus sp.]|nr:hypothetical protein [Desulforhopalus sp.]
MDNPGFKELIDLIQETRKASLDDPSAQVFVTSWNIQKDLDPEEIVEIINTEFLRRNMGLCLSETSWQEEITEE